MTFDILKVFVHMVVAPLLGGILRVDGLDISTSTHLPLSRRKSSIISGLSELAVGRIKSLTRVGTERMRCDAVGRGEGSREVAG